MAAVGAEDVRFERLMVLGRALRLEAAAMPAVASLEEGGVRLPSMLPLSMLLRTLLVPSLLGHAMLLPMVWNRCVAAGIFSAGKGRAMNWRRSPAHPY